MAPQVCAVGISMEQDENWSVDINVREIFVVAYNAVAGTRFVEAESLKALVLDFCHVCGCVSQPGLVEQGGLLS